MSPKTKLAIGLLWFLVLLSLLWMFVPAVSTTGLSAFRWFSPTKVYVQIGPGLGLWPLAEAVEFVDQHTSTQAVIGDCRRGSRCIRVTSNPKLPIHIAGRASWSNEVLEVRVEFNPAYASRPVNSRLQMSVHELGHAFGIHSHNPLCTSVMYAYITCQGEGIPPKKFTAAEVEILERH